MEDELITLYTREAPSEPILCARKEYYDNDFTKYKEHYPALIDVFLFNKSGEILLQRRGRNKRVNPGKFHTSVGGHINWGEKPEFALVHECMDELGAPVFSFPHDTYDEAIKKLDSYTHKVALAKEIREFFRDYSKSDVKDQRSIKDRIWLYFGRYDGPTEVPDGEVAGYNWFNFDNIENELNNNPDQFTNGLKIYFSDFKDEMRSFVNKYCKTDSNSS